MPVEPILILIVVAVLVNLAVMSAVVLPPVIGRRGLFSLQGLGYGAEPVALDVAHRTRAPGDEPVTEADLTTWAYDRVVRIVSWVFILATSTIVAVTGLWSENHPAIFVLLALAGLFVLVVHDLLPPATLGAGKFIVEGSVAITFGTLLIMLTGRAESPFFFVFPLIVGGAALVVGARVTLTLAAAASLGYLVALTAGAPDPLGPETVATIGINLTALILLAYVAMVIAREQRRARDAAIRLSTVDPLTGLFNRTFFFTAMEREIARSMRSGRPFCLLMADLDDLKATNDVYGHFIGDLVLRGVGEVVRSSVRRVDVPARYGGDEFVVLLPETDRTGAQVVAEKIRTGVAQLDVPGTEARTSLSVGIVTHPGDGHSADDLMIAADQAMYSSKRAGKNQVRGIAVAGGRSDLAG